MRIVCLVLSLVLAGPTLAAGVPEPGGYRTEAYRAPVPSTLSGATVVDGDAAYALWKTGLVAFVDVLPRTPRPADLPEGTLFREKPRDTIPGAIWLANVGYGALADETVDYFKAGLAEATNGDPSTPVVLFCLTDCWMSWNAAKRIQEWGYDHVFWYPGGTDDWAAMGHPLERVEPFAE